MNSSIVSLTSLSPIIFVYEGAQAGAGQSEYCAARGRRAVLHSAATSPNNYTCRTLEDASWNTKKVGGAVDQLRARISVGSRFAVLE